MRTLKYYLFSLFFLLFFWGMPDTILEAEGSFIHTEEKIPVYFDARQILDKTDKKTGIRQTIYVTTSTPVWVTDFYCREMNRLGWKLLFQKPEKLSFLCDTFLLSFSKEEATLNICASRKKESDKTIITIFYSKES